MYSLPALPYDFAALEPHIDAQTMEIHHDKHHQAYIDKLNAALTEHQELFQNSVEELVAKINELPDSVQKAVQNHGGGHANHSLFWTILSADGGGQPEGELLTAIETKFGDFASFQAEFSSTAGAQFGSGWGWLVVGQSGELEILATPNQDSPLSQGKTPILGVDVWEHAYYLNYQNRRPDYLAAFWNIVNWPEVARRYQEAG
jgi:Fe-Mn family superoxide dismutase